MQVDYNRDYMRYGSDCCVLTMTSMTSGDGHIFSGTASRWTTDDQRLSWNISRTSTSDLSP